MIKYITFLCFYFLCNVCFAQLPDGSVAPDFTLTDINGVDHNLYSLLDEGKHVVLDILSTGCAPCWEYHLEGVLKDLWNQHGPDGTDQVYIFMIETNLDSPLEYLYGNGPSSLTYGDWVTGTPYPIIDDDTPSTELPSFSQVMYDFELTFWPTIYHICPDRIITLTGQLPSVNDYLAFMEGCQPLVGDNNARLVELVENFDTTGCGLTNFTPTLRVQNMGNSILSSATINLSIDNVQTEEIQWSGNLAPFQYEDVAFAEIELGNYNLDFVIVNPNGSPDEFLADDSINKNISYSNISLTTSTVTVEIMTDIFGEDTYWAIINDADEIMAEGGNSAVGLTNYGIGNGSTPLDPNAYNQYTNYNVNVDLSEGCYTLVVTDYWGDGMGGNGSEPGFYKIADANGVTYVEGSEFDGIISHKFEINSGLVNTNNLDNDVYKLYASPNPIEDILQVSIKSLDQHITNYQYKIQNSFGQTIIRQKSFLVEEEVSIDLSQLNAGIYYLTVLFENKNISLPIIKM